MAEQEKVGKKEFKIFLEKKFATTLNIDIISKQFFDAEEELKKSLGVKSIPSFYSDAEQYLVDNPISIDSTGKIDTNIIKQITKKVEDKEIQEKQILDEERKKKENIEDNTIQEEIDEKKKYEDRLLQIKAVDDTIEKYGGIEKFLKDATRDEIDQFTSLRKEQQVFDDVDEIIVRKINNPDYEFTSEEQEKLVKSKQGRLFQYNSTSGKFDDSLKAEQYIIKLEVLKHRMQDKALGNNGIIDLNELNNIKNDEEFSIVFEIKNDEEIQQMINEIQEEYKANQRQNIKQRNSHEQAMPEDVLKTTKGDTIATEEIQENFEIFMQRAMQNMPDYAVEEQLQTEDQPQQEPSKENKYETPTFEVKRTGLAGLFSMMVNSRAVKAVTNLFKPKDKQDRLGPGQPHKTIKNGLTITTYDARGNSIESWSNIVKRWARNNGEKIMEGVLSITNLGRKDKENEVLNTPTVVQGIADEQQTPIQEQIQHEQEKAKVNESKGVQPRFADSNQWAVDLNTIDSDGTQNISVVELDSQDKSGQEEEKEFGD